MKVLIQRSLIIASCAVCLLALPASRSLHAEQVSVSTIDGEQFQGELESWNERELRLTGDEGTTTLPTQQVLRVAPVAKFEKEIAPQAAYLLLVDGTRLPLADFSHVDRKLRFSTGLSEEPLSVPSEQVLLVNLAPEERDDDALLQAVGDKPQSGDVLVIFKNNRESIDFLTGIIGDLEGEHFSFNWDGEVVPVRRNRIAALAFHQARPRDSETPKCLLTTRSGARLPLIKYSLDGELLRGTTVGGLELVVPVADLLAADCSGGKLVYLSDLKPLAEKWTPLVQVPASAGLIKDFGKPRRDSSFQGSALSLSWPGKIDSIGSELKTYNKGLALRSRTELEYRIPQDVRRFSAIAGIDPAMASQGNVELRILVDGEVKFQEIVAVEPVAIDVDLRNASRLGIVVDFGSNLDFGDQLHLVDARMTK